MQRVRAKLQKLQQDPSLTPSPHMVRLRPKQFIDQHDYHAMEQGKVTIHMIMTDTLAHILQMNNK